MKKRVLIVDDDASIRESLRTLLIESGYEVMLAADGEEAEQRLAKDSVDLLLLDLEMPKRDGWDVFENLSSHHSSLPVIMITGLADQLDTKLIPGLDALLEKPIDVTALLKKLEALLAESAEKRLERLRGCLESKRPFAAGAPGYLSLQGAIHSWGA